MIIHLLCLMKFEHIIFWSCFIISYVHRKIRIEDRQVKTKDIKKLHSQINYSNTVLTIMTKQLTRLENSTSSLYHKEVSYS